MALVTGPLVSASVPPVANAEPLLPAVAPVPAILPATTVLTKFTVLLAETPPVVPPAALPTMVLL